MIERPGMIHPYHHRIADRRMPGIAGLGGKGQVGKTEFGHRLLHETHVRRLLGAVPPDSRQPERQTVQQRIARQNQD